MNTLTPTELNVLRDARQRVLARIASAAHKSGRTPADVTLVAVTKSGSISQIAGLLSMGQLELGESRVQQLVERCQALSTPACQEQILAMATPDVAPVITPQWHMIGHLQRNKIKQVLPHVSLIHSVDSLRLASEINNVCLSLDRRMEVLLQINIAQEEQKHGVDVAQALELGAQIAKMQHLKLRGIMTMAPYCDDPETSRPVFAKANAIFNEMARQLPSMDSFSLLSMGMSNDYEVAIEEGANMVRVGSALFES